MKRGEKSYNTTYDSFSIEMGKGLKLVEPLFKRKPVHNEFSHAFTCDFH